jgi:hypothetical protein
VIEESITHACNSSVTGFNQNQKLDPLTEVRRINLTKYIYLIGIEKSEGTTLSFNLSEVDNQPYINNGTFNIALLRFNLSCIQDKFEISEKIGADSDEYPEIFKVLMIVSGILLLSLLLCFAGFCCYIRHQRARKSI